MEEQLGFGDVDGDGFVGVDAAESDFLLVDLLDDPVEALGARVGTCSVSATRMAGHGVSIVVVRRVVSGNVRYSAGIIEVPEPQPDPAGIMFL